MGSGFSPRESLEVTLVGEGDNGQRSLAELTVSDDGHVSGVVPLPVDIAPGRYQVLAGQGAAESVESDLWVVLEEARIDPRSYAAHPRDLLELAGGGFAPGETVRVYLVGSPEVDLASLRADDRGALASATVEVPDVTPGVWMLAAEGLQTGVAVQRQISVLGYTPWVILSVYALKPGGTVDASGYGFAPGEEVKVTLDGTKDATRVVRADGDGRAAVRAVFVARPQDVGRHRLTLVGAWSRSPVDAEFEVLAYVPKLALARYAGPAGSEVSFSGEGFAPGETIRVYLERGSRRDQVADFVASQAGAFDGAGTCTVSDQMASGRLRFVVVGDGSRAPVSQDFEVQDTR